MIRINENPYAQNLLPNKPAQSAKNPTTSTFHVRRQMCAVCNYFRRDALNTTYFGSSKRVRSKFRNRAAQPLAAARCCMVRTQRGEGEERDQQWPRPVRASAHKRVHGSGGTARYNSYRVHICGSVCVLSHLTHRRYTDFVCIGGKSLVSCASALPPAPCRRSGCRPAAVALSPAPELFEVKAAGVLSLPIWRAAALPSASRNGTGVLINSDICAGYKSTTNNGQSRGCRALGAGCDASADAAPGCHGGTPVRWRRRRRPAATPMAGNGAGGRWCCRCWLHDACRSRHGL